jgi:hypothetical protein
VAISPGSGITTCCVPYVDSGLSYLYAVFCGAENIRKAGDCLALEDSANGLAASLGAGIVTVVLVNEYTRNQAFSGAVAVLFDLGEAGTPCRVLAGDAGEHGLVDVNLLRRWHHLGSIPASGGCNEETVKAIYRPGRVAFACNSESA